MIDVIKEAALQNIPNNVINGRKDPLLSKNLKIKIYKTIILPVVLYGCETWSLILREEYRQRVFGNRILRRIFGPKKDENGERNFIVCSVHLI